MCKNLDRTKIDEKHVSVAISEKVSKNVPEISICSALFQEADVLQT